MSQKYIKSQNKNSHNAKTLVKDVAFEEAHGKAVVGSNAPSGGLTPDPSPTGEGSGNNGGGNNGGGGDDDSPNEN